MVLDLATVRAYVKVPATSLTDEELQRMLAACTADQVARCAVPDPLEDPGGYDLAEAALDQALLRRVQREIAARVLPLGMVGLDAAEYGPQRLPYFDSLIEEHERGYRMVVLG
jgi:hypothetical protein